MPRFRHRVENNIRLMFWILEHVCFCIFGNRSGIDGNDKRSAVFILLRYPSYPKAHSSLGQKKGSSSNHPFSGVNSLIVLGSVMSINLFDLFRGYIKNCGVGQMIHRFHRHFSESVLVVHGFISHRIHVWYISLHLVDFYGKCR